MNLREDSGYGTADRAILEYRGEGQQKRSVHVWLVSTSPALRQTCSGAIDQMYGFVRAGLYSTAGGALEALRQENAPEILLLEMDPSTPGQASALEAIRAEAPETKVIVLAESADLYTVSRIFLAGAEGYLLKDAPLGEIVEGIRNVHRGDACMSAAVAKLAVELLRSGSVRPTRPQYPLTTRERLHLQLLTRGLSKKEIAGQLCISFHTVDTHLRSIYRKLKVNTRSAAVAKAVHEGLC